MKSILGVLAVAALLPGVIATNALCAGRGGGNVGSGIMENEVDAGGFRGGEPFLDTVPSTPPILNPSSPYTVPQSPETPVSPSSPGSIFGNGGND